MTHPCPLLAALAVLAVLGGANGCRMAKHARGLPSLKECEAFCGKPSEVFWWIDAHGSAPSECDCAGIQ